MALIIGPVFARAAEYFGKRRARARNWSPEGQGVELEISESSNPALFGQRIHGTIISIGTAQDSRLPEAEIRLDAPLTIGASGDATSTIIAAPHFKYHSWPRLLVAPIHAVLSAASLSDSDARKHSRTFGRAIIRLA